VFLEVVTLARDVCIDLFLVGETNTGHFTHGRVRLFRRRGINTDADTTPLRASIQRARFALFDDNLASFAN
jgi:hypothetical protein